MDNVGYRIYQNFKRPSKTLVEKFRGIPVANIDDCMNRTASLSSALMPVNDRILLGTAYTLTAAGGDNLLFYYAIDNAEPGDVIVVAGGGYTERALCGEIMAAYAKKRGIAGFVVDGAIRDKKQLSEMDFPVYAVSSISNGPYKNGPGCVNVPISIGNQVVFPGDIIVGDDTGIVAIRPEDAESLYEKSLKVIEKEAEMMKSIEEKGIMDLSWLYRKLEEDHCQIINAQK
ncbi:MAG: dimethylmenaquinone methyltransferase [Lacrimispora sp.]|jgi:regulator of RNase E activity RraA|nr:dimethylmenaquinone methyltransferase [Lacrimispora sp.]